MEGLSDVIAQIWDMLLMCVYVLVILTVIIFGFQVQTYNTYLQQVNYQVERKGGLTEEAISELTNISREHYGNWYSIESSQLGEKVRFGETVDYTVVGKFPILMASRSYTFTLPISAQSISKVR